MAQSLKGIVKAVCTSPAKGTEKRPVEEAYFVRISGSGEMRMRENGTGR